ncbi:3-hydroxyacyl-ACP dehydratase FabZ family protein [Dickeya fangzhongdai]|uniref:3-hydroxyacyl-ACP dehydratase FabZ family protein n=1 Tax=Dickeya fangzhongdai TaxID=1778540 RepID=UPI0004F6838A|nr:hydroxymyristoyl-ACP dehydratase [Dickeya fangzhongdai]AIR69988.1 hydroxymyristoyl-ACP dehydratase [Dickeya fangzhongdai]KGT97636.1 hydroxymyristoyl-ACP dehydratase [Dickeya fangzhongdai]KHN60586.1 hydroxymyristoyl-ACP dehydratase [Dickeya fangzhongdai]WPD74119.1 hydroxymyristoyl-ACP dehydratase [Dickeya fangzhongdai]
MLPVELSRACSPSQAELLLYVDAGLFWFDGHFPRQPLLPGVAQLDWALHYGREILAPGWRFLSVENIKFQHPVLPDKTLRLTLNWLEEKQQLTFSYHIVVNGPTVVNGQIAANGQDAPAQTGQAASSGKIRLCR